MEKMTKREFMTAVMNGEINDEVKLFAKEQIQKIDAANEAHKAKAEEKRKMNVPLMDKIYNDILGEEPVTATVVGEYMELSTQKASALLRMLVEEGRAEKTEVKVPNKGIQKGYKKI